MLYHKLFNHIPACPTSIQAGLMARQGHIVHIVFVGSFNLKYSFYHRATQRLHRVAQRFNRITPKKSLITTHRLLITNHKSLFTHHTIICTFAQNKVHSALNVTKKNTSSIVVASKFEGEIPEPSAIYDYH